MLEITITFMLQNKNTLVLELRSHSQVVFMPEITITFVLENEVAFVLEITETKDSGDGERPSASG